MWEYIKEKSDAQHLQGKATAGDVDHRSVTTHSFTYGPGFFALFGADQATQQLVAAATARMPQLAQRLVTAGLEETQLQSLFGGELPPSQCAVALIVFSESTATTALALAEAIAFRANHTEIVLFPATKDYDWTVLFADNQPHSRFLLTDPPFHPLKLTHLLQNLAEKHHLRRQLENEQQIAATKLEEKNVELNKMLLKLQESREEIKTGDRIKNEFLANISHEMRTPVHGIQGISEILLDSELANEQRELVETIRGSSELLLSIVDNVLNFSRLQDSEFSLDSIKFDPAKLFEDIAVKAYRDANAKGLQFGLFLKQEIPAQLIGDPIRIRAIISALLGNAIKFTENGSVLIETEYRSGNLLVSVTDTGIGIKEGDGDRLFQPFQQSDNSSTRRYGGIGLGLSLARQLVLLMGGDIGLKSTPGKGSMFWFLIPLDATGEPSGRSAVAPAGIRGQRSLIITKSPPLSLVLSGYLKEWQSTVNVVSNPQNAIDIVKNGNIDIIFADEAGYDDWPRLVERLRKQSKNTDLQIVLCLFRHEGIESRTAYADHFDLTMDRLIRRSTLIDVVQQLAVASNAAAGRTLPKSKPGALLASQGRKDRLKSAQFPPKQASRDLPQIDSHVLIVEDNRVNQRILIRILKQNGFTADIAANGVEALDLLKTSEYDIVIMDCHMPLMDGFETTRQIRRKEAETCQKPLPILALTANVLDGAREQCLASGMTDYLSKPVNRKLLMEKIASLISPASDPRGVS